MSLQSIKRWQWLVLSIVLGSCLAFSQKWSADDLESYGEGLNDQRDFERRLIHQLGGQPMFKDIYVTRQTLDDGSGHSQTVYLVSGKSTDGTVKPDGKYHWQPTCFVAHVPYRPTSDLYSLTGRGGMGAAIRWNKVENPTVVDFLRLAHQGSGVSFTYAWWRTYPFSIWLGGSFLLIGLLWPCLIDLSYYGRLFRPREARGVGLWQVHSPTKTAPPEATAPDLGRLHELEEELEEKLRGSNTTARSADDSGMAAPRSLQSAPLVVARVEPPPDDRAFSAEPDDFYPTEDRLHVTRKSEPN